MGEKEEGQGRRDEAEAMAVGEWVEEEEEEEEAAEEREGAKGVALRWERFLPRVPVRVLLVEGDDSTRQIIAALLRKCSYRVAAASDGLKAWDVLMEKPQSVDLVLTEVDLPSISGFGLLTMIMDHESCRNIPVIMMSSHDSISMVFKCMLKGAADFLIKPIRKNELRNLWQHVWRRQIVDGHGGTHNIQDKREAMHKMKAHSGEKEHSIENIAIVQANKEFGEQGSDAQSSCTRSDVEAESTHKQLKLKQTKVVDAFMTQNGGNIQMDNGSVNHENTITESENVDEVQECLGYKKTNNKNYDQKCHHEIISKDDDLVHVVDNQPQGRLPSRDIVHVTNVKHKLCAAPYLELSLKRYEGTFPEKQECGGSNIWNHSSSSAFSLYTGRTLIPTMLEQKNSSSETNGLKPIEPLKDLDSRGNMEETKSSDVGPSVQDGMAVQCTPLRVIPFPLPVGSMPSSSGYDTVMQQMFYPQSGHPFWSTNPSIWREGTMQTNSSIQPCQKNCNSVQCDLPDEENVRSSCYPSAGKQEEHHMQLDEKRQVSSAVGESGSSSICNGSRNFKSSECGSVLSGTTGHTSATHVFGPKTVTGNDESKLTCDGSKPEDCHLLTQREIALNKFRLKRKERCFEKKVRYHSRKLLAEQRPRVKGQFVRQERPEPQPGQAGAFQSESAAA